MFDACSGSDDLCHAQIWRRRIVSKVQGSLNFQSRFTDTFLKRGRRWQVVARHYSRIPTERTAINLDSKIYDAYIGQYEIAPSVVLDIIKEGEKLMSQTIRSKVCLSPRR